MTDESPSQQRAAEDALDDAIHACVAARDSLPPGAVLTRWMVIGTGIGMSDGEEITAGFYLLPGDQAVDWHSLLGLLRATSLRCEREFLDGGKDWDSDGGS